MKVIDAGVVVELVAGGLSPERVGEAELATPHLLDTEVANALRRLVLRGHLTDDQGSAALKGLTITRYPANRLRPRMWELRHDVSAYDATYLALTEQIGASALLTTDARLAKASGVRCRVQVL